MEYKIKFYMKNEWLISQLCLSSAVLVDLYSKAFSSGTFQRKLEMVLAFLSQIQVE